MGAYALIAAGLLNWDYQRSAPHIALHSLAIIVPGLLLLAATFAPAARSFLMSKVGRAAVLIGGAAALAYAFIN